MDHLVTLFAPRNAIDFVAKAILFLLALGGMNYARDVLSTQDGHDGFLDNFLEAAFVGLPFVLLSLALVGHLNRLQRKLARLATTDVLTGLPNRRAFIEAVQKRQSRKGDDVLLMIDVDHFKRINDTHGHETGDRCLRDIAAQLRACIRPKDEVARIGGEEFAALLLDIQSDDATAIADRISRGILFVCDAQGLSVPVTLSVGVTPLYGSEALDTALSRADRALYAAKEQGRARSVLAQPQPSQPPLRVSA